MEYAESIIDLVGEAPLVGLSRVTADLGPGDGQPLLLAKMEMLNPGGSVKDCIGAPMIAAEASPDDAFVRLSGGAPALVVVRDD